MKNNFSLRKALALAALLLGGLASNLSAVTTIKVGSAAEVTALTADYSTISAAYTAIPTAMTLGAYVIELQSSYDPTVETYPITFAAKTGSSATNTITIKPATGAKITMGPANKTVIATVTGSTFTSATTSVDLSSIITSGNISYLSGNVAASDITLTTTAGSATATINSGTLTNGTTYYVSGNASIPARRTFTYSGSATITLSSGTTVTAGSAVACKATPTTNSFVSGIGTFNNPDFYNISGISGNVITVPTGTFNATSALGNKLFIGPAQTCAFKFNGCKYVTIDGVSRTDASTGLTIQNPNCIYAQAIMFTNASQYNTVKNCVIRGANQTGAWNNGYDGTVYFSGATYTTIANNDICDMNDANIPYPISSIQMTSAGGTNTNQTITNNNIYNISNLYSGNGNYGFLVFGSDANANNFNITYNRFYWTAETTFKSVSYNFLAFATIGSGHRFEGNVIGYKPDGTSSILNMTGTPTTSYGFSALKNSVFKNNTIGGITIKNGGSFVAINLAPHTAGSVPADSICYGNTIKDITINATNTGQTLYGIYFNAAPNCNVNVKNNVVKNLTISSSTASNAENIAAISHNFGAYSINITSTSGSTAATLASASLISGTTYTITNNANITNGTTFTYSGSTSITLSAGAIGTGSAVASTLSSIDISCVGNEVSNLTAGSAGSSANHSLTAFVSGGCSNVYDKNLVYNLNTITSNTGAVIKGMRFAISKSSGITVKNNIIRLGTDVSSDATISAIINEGLSSNGHAFNIYHNSIYIGGGTGLTLTKPSHCLSRSTAISGAISVKNNIFSNKRIGGAVNQIFNLYAATDITTSSNNLYEYGSLFGTVTTTSPTTYAAMTDWVTAKSPTVVEAGSIDQTSPNFVDATATIPDLRIIGNTSVVDAVGADLSASVSDDFYGSARSGLTPHDLGAYAYTVDVSAPSVEITAPSVASTTAWPTIPISITFSEAVTGFTSADITVGNATLSDFTVIDASHYTAILNTTRNGVNDVVVTADIAASAAQDLATNASTLATQFSRTFSVATGAALLKESASVYASHGAVVIAASAGQKASIFSATGQLLKSVKLTSDNVSVPMAKGFYVVVANGHQTKVMVK